MQRKKARVDAGIAAADQDKGLLLVLTGPGKGKSSSAFGMLARAVGHGMRAGVAQFIKGRSDTGEEAFFRSHPSIDWHVLGEGFTWETQSFERDKQTAQTGWAIAKDMLSNPDIGLVILDELTYPIHYQWLTAEQVLGDLADRPPMQHVVITGRSAHKDLIAAADTVSEIADIKHAYRAGIRAQPGVDL